MKKKLTAVLLSAVLCAAPVFHTAANATIFYPVETAGMVRVDCGKMFGENTELYLYNNSGSPCDSAILAEYEDGVMRQGHIRFASSPTDYAYNVYVLSGMDLDTLKSTLETYTAENLPGYEVIKTKQFEGLDVIRVKPVDEIDEYTYSFLEDGTPVGVPEWMLSADKCAERIGVAVQIYNALGLTPYYVIPMLLEANPSLGMYGDVDEDGSITLKDAMKAMKLSDNAALMDDTLETYHPAADVDDDGKVTLRDAMYILRYVDRVSLGYSPTFDEIIGT